MQVSKNYRIIATINNKNTNDMGIEEWRPVRGYEGKYEVSSLGYVRTLSWKNKEGDIRLLSRIEDSDGAYRVALYRKEWRDKFVTRYKLVPIAQLVAVAFLKVPRIQPSLKGKMNVIHINGDPKNDKVDNLKWASPKETANNPTCLARRSNSRKYLYFGKRKGFNEWETIKKRVPESAFSQEHRDNISKQAKRRVVQMTLTGTVIKVWESATDAQNTLKQSGIHQSKICGCCQGKRHSAGGFKWAYETEQQKEVEQ